MKDTNTGPDRYGQIARATDTRFVFKGPQGTHPVHVGMRFTFRVERDPTDATQT
jgi:hypothetical protein